MSDEKQSKNDAAFKQAALDFINQLPIENESEPYIDLRKKINAVEPPDVEKKLLELFKEHLLEINHAINQLSVHESTKEEAVINALNILKKHQIWFDDFILKQNALIFIQEIIEKSPSSLDLMLKPLYELSKMISAISLETDSGIKNKIFQQFNLLISQYQQNLDYLKSTTGEASEQSKINNLESLINKLSEFVVSQQLLPENAQVSEENTASAIVSVPQTSANNNSPELPAEVWTLIFQLSSLESIFNLAMTTKVLNNIVHALPPGTFMREMDRPFGLHNRVPLFFYRSKKESLNLCTAAQKFGEYGDYLAGDSNGNILLFDGNNKIKLKHKAHQSKLMCIESCSTDMILTVSEKSNLRFWNLKNNELTLIHEVNFKLNQISDIKIEYNPKFAGNYAQKDVYFLENKKFWNGLVVSHVLKYTLPIPQDNLNYPSHFKPRESYCNPRSVGIRLLEGNFNVLCDQYGESKPLGKAIEKVDFVYSHTQECDTENTLYRLEENEERKKVIGAVILRSGVVWIQSVQNNFFGSFFESENDQKTKFKSRKCVRSNKMSLNPDEKRPACMFILPWKSEDSSQRLFVEVLNEPDVFIIAQDKQIKIYRFEPEPKDNETYFVLLDEKHTHSPIVGISQDRNRNLMIACVGGVQRWYFKEHQPSLVPESSM